MVSEINAELLLQQLYPDMERSWTAKHKGVFYRNYTADAIHIYQNENLVELARDSILKQLPKEMLSAENELDSVDANGKKVRKSWKTRHQEIHERLHLLYEAFSPFDSFRFSRTMEMERHTQEILEMKLQYILKYCFDFDLEAEQNDLVREAAVLLPYVSKMRGIPALLARILEILTGYRVTMQQSTFSHRDTTRAWIPWLRFSVIVPGLETEEDYMLKEAELRPVMDFLLEHLAPADMLCEIDIKDAAPAQQGGKLKYNAYVR